MNKITLKNSLYGLIGAIVLGFGIGTWDFVRLGFDAINVFYNALCNITGLSFSAINFIGGAVMIVTCIIIDRKQLGIATFINIVVIALSIKYTGYFYSHFYTDNFFVKLLIHFVGLNAIALGAAMIVVCDLGKSQYDAFVFAIASKSKKSFVFIRYIVDGVALTLGILLGGSYGIGTIIAILFIGHLMKQYIKVLKR